MALPLAERAPTSETQESTRKAKRKPPPSPRNCAILFSVTCACPALQTTALTTLNEGYPPPSSPPPSRLTRVTFVLKPYRSKCRLFRALQSPGLRVGGCCLQPMGAIRSAMLFHVHYLNLPATPVHLLNGVFSIPNPSALRVKVSKILPPMPVPFPLFARRQSLCVPH